MTKFLVTGCGRSGTGWAADLFTLLGYECTHEGQFNLSRNGPLRGGESSWLAIPHLRSLEPSTRVLRIVRDPYSVVRSALARGFFATPSGPYEQYALKHCPPLRDATDQLGYVIRWAALWDVPLVNTTHRVLPVDGSIGRILQAIHYVTGRGFGETRLEQMLVKVGTKTNTNLGPAKREISRQEIISHPDGWMLHERAQQFGYGWK